MARSHEEIKKLLTAVSTDIDMDEHGGGLVLDKQGKIIANFTYSSKGQVNAAWFVASPIYVRQLLQEIKDLKVAQKGKESK